MSNELVISSKIENISLVENFIDQLSVKYSFNSDIYGNVLVATIEAATNAIVHGNKSDASKNVILSVENINNRLTIRVEDKGEGFDINSIPDPTKPEFIEKPDGRGVFLMNQLTDEVIFENNGSIVNLIFNL